MSCFLYLVLFYLARSQLKKISISLYHLMCTKIKLRENAECPFHLIFIVKASNYIPVGVLFVVSLFYLDDY